MKSGTCLLIRGLNPRQNLMIQTEVKNVPTRLNIWYQLFVLPWKNVFYIDRSHWQVNDFSYYFVGMWGLCFYHWLCMVWCFYCSLIREPVVYQFSRVSGIATEQARIYLELITDEESLTDEELQARFKQIQNADSKPWGCLELPAHKRAAIALERTDTTRDLTNSEKLAAWLAGDLPR